MGLLDFIRQKYHPLWWLRQWRWFRTISRLVDFPVTVTTGNVRYSVMWLRDLPSFLSSDGDEQETKSILSRLLDVGGVDCLFDVGGNIGAYAWSALSLCPDLQVFLFEPDPINAKLIRRTLEMNQFKHVTLWEGVVAQDDLPRQFLLDEVSGTGGSLNDDRDRDDSFHHRYGLEQTREVASTTLDHYLDALVVPRPEIVIKIDVESAEADVLRGGLKFIAKYRPTLIVECYEPDKLAEFRGLGYVWYRIADGANLLLVPSERGEEFFNKGIPFSRNGKRLEEI